jgi:25S rRNA (uracil2843-N3)-methyltransferase
MVKRPSKKTRPAKSSKPKPASSSSATAAPSSTTTTTQLDTKHQQHLLTIFSEAFATALASETFPALLQEIKQALFHRDFAAAFGREDYLEAYAARWAPTRALGYAAVLKALEGYLAEVVPGEDATLVQEAEEITGEVGDDGVRVEVGVAVPILRKQIKMISIGGCASEQVAFASYLSQTSLSGQLTLVDSAPWSHVTSLIQEHITTPPQLSRYTSAALKASSRALVESSQLSLSFIQQDVLQLEKEKLAELLGTQPLVVTILFTLNELYTNGGIGKTTKFLANLGQALPGRSLLLVLDSPGSYSEAAVGKEKKRYPMQWLLDHTLIGTDGSGYRWEKLESHDSIWFRLPEGLSYPMQLENMRYQMHLYRIEKASPEMKDAE